MNYKNKIRKYLAFFLYSFCLLLFLSPDSYIYDLYHRCDTAWFFTCGKAWMNGLVPYVDFADSKGPLLWLIYGCGYLLSHYSYIGVFWISCAFYTISFVFAYKLCRMFISKNASILVLALLPLFLFYKKYHYEVRAEDFCYTFVFISLYYVCKMFKGVDKRQLFKLSFVVGVCVMCCMLIKWSIALMMSGFAFVVLYYSFKNKTVNGLVGGLTGMIAIAIPFLIYFLLQGNFSAFISEYFCNTYSTVSKPFKETLILYLRDWVAVKKSFILFFIGIILFCRKYKMSYWLNFCLFTFLAIVVYALWEYYNSVLMPFAIFLFIVVVDYIEHKFGLDKTKMTFASVICVIGSVVYNIHTDKSFVFKEDKYRQSYYDVSQLMAQTKNPKVMFYVQDFGIGILANDLPACKYWSRQHGATSVMEQERRKALNERLADFIFVSNFGTPLIDVTEEELKKLDYVYLGETIGENTDLYVYCKKELYKELPHVQLNTLDLLLKKNLFCEK